MSLHLSKCRIARNHMAWLISEWTDQFTITLPFWPKVASLDRKLAHATFGVFFASRHVIPNNVAF